MIVSVGKVSTKKVDLPRWLGILLCAGSGDGVQRSREVKYRVAGNKSGAWRSRDAKITDSEAGGRPKGAREARRGNPFPRAPGGSREAAGVKRSVLRKKKVRRAIGCRTSFCGA